MRHFWPSTLPSALPLMLTMPSFTPKASHVMSTVSPPMVTDVSAGWLPASRATFCDKVQVPSSAGQKDRPYAVCSCPEVHDR